MEKRRCASSLPTHGRRLVQLFASSCSPIWAAPPRYEERCWRVKLDQQSRRSYSREIAAASRLVYPLGEADGRKARPEKRRRAQRRGEEQPLGGGAIGHLWRSSEKPTLSSWATRRSKLVLSIYLSLYCFSSVVWSSWKLASWLAVTKLISCLPSGEFQPQTVIRYFVCVCGVVWCGLISELNGPCFSSPHWLCV